MIDNIKLLESLKQSMVMSDLKGKENYTPSKTYKPSGLKCIRGMYFQLTGAPRAGATSSHCSIGIKNSGTDIHERVQSYFEDMKSNGFDCEYIDVETFLNERGITNLIVKGKSGMETRLYSPEHNISFMCDGIIKFEGEYSILEIKTETNSKFYTRTEVNKDHYLQGTAYSYLLGLDDVMFLYVCRDNLDMKTFIFTPTGEMKTGLINKLKDCDTYIANNEVPPKPDNITTYDCRYCDYREICKNS